MARKMYKRKRKFTRKTRGKKFINKIVKTVLHRQLENKFLKGTLSQVTQTYVGTIYPLLATPTAISQGTGSSDRLGIKIRPRKLQLHFVINGNALGNLDQPLRLIVFRSRNEGGNIPTPNYVLDNVDTSTINAVRAFYEYDNVRLFTILSDNVYYVGNGTTTNNAIGTNNTASNRPFEIQVNKTYYGKKLEKSTSYLIGSNSIEDGGFYLLSISSVAANSPQLAYTMRFEYEDA